MSATAVEVVIRDLGGNVVNATVVATRKIRTGTDWEMPDTTLYFHLTSAGRIFVGAKPTGRMAEIIPVDAPWVGKSPVFYGFDLYGIPVGATFLSAYLYGEMTGVGGVVSTFVAVLKLESLSLAANAAPEVFLFNISAFLENPSTITSGGVPCLGYAGPDSDPSNAFVLSLPLGWLTTRFAEIGLNSPPPNVIGYDAAYNQFLWRVEMPDGLPVVSSGPLGRPPRLSTMAFSEESGGGGSWINGHLLLVRKGTSGCRLMMAEYLLEDEYTLWRDLLLTECVEGSPSLRMSDLNTTEVSLGVPGLREFLSTCIPTSLALGWGLGTSVPVEPYSAGIVGAPSVVVGGYGYVNVYGDGAGTSTFANSYNPTSPPHVDKIACSWSGRIHNPALDWAETGYPNLSRGAVVLVSGGYVFRSVTGLDFGQDDPVLNLPALPISASDRADMAYSVDLKYYDSDGISETGTYIPAGWYLTLFYVQTSDSHVMFRCYKSVDDGWNWTIETTVDCTQYATDKFYELYSVNPTTCTHGKQLSVGDVSVTVLTTKMQVGFVGMVGNTAGLGDKYFEVRVVKHGASSGWVVECFQCASNREGSFHPCMQISQGSLPRTYIVSGDGQYIRSMGWEATTIQELIGSSLGGTFNPVLFDSGDFTYGNPDWVMAAGLSGTPMAAGYFFPARVGVDGAEAIVVQPPSQTHNCYFSFREDSGWESLASIEKFRAYPKATGAGVSMADYEVAYVYTSQGTGTLVFLRNPSGLVTHVLFSSDGMQQGFNFIFGSYSPRVFVPYQFYALGLAVSDIYPHSELVEGNVVTTLYLIADGYATIYALDPVTLVFSEVSSTLGNRSNVKLAKVGALWLATHGASSTGVLTSTDLQEWKVAIEPGDGDGALSSKALDILPIGTETTESKVLTDVSWPSIYADPVP